MRRFIAIAVFFAGCVEYDIGKPMADEGPGEDDPGDTAVWPTDADTGETDIDTGGDGPIEDVDSDPEPEESCDELEVPADIVIDESCRSEPVTGTMDVRVEWEMDSFFPMFEYDEILSAPVVGQLTDDNGDGVIDHLDTPDIVATFDDGGEEGNSHGILRRIDGDGHESEALLENYFDDENQYYPYRYAGVALGDINGDGATNIVTLVERIPGPPEDGPPDEGGPPPEDDPVGPPPPPTDPGLSCHPIALEADGTVLWVSLYSMDCGGHAPALADLEGDGDVEIIIGAGILNGADGTVQGIGTEGVGASMVYEEMGSIAAVSDLDGDGTQEILAGSTIYMPDGSIHCMRSDPSKDGFTASADFDMDGDGDVVVVGNNEATVMDMNCNETANWTLPGTGTGGPPTIADFDADGEPEIGIATATHYTVYDPNGTELWRHPVTDASSHATGSTVFDFEGDGRPEVVYADEENLFIFDGPTGEVRFQDSNHTSRTLHEFPLVVDVDGDGYPEIIVPNGGGHHGLRNKGLYVLGSSDESWLGGPKVWNQHAFNIVNINDDLSIPTTPESNWPLHNNFRSGDLNTVYGEDAPDAIPVAEACTLECESGIIRVGVRLANQGTATLRSDMVITVYAVAEPEWTSVEVLAVSPPIYPGDASTPFLLEIAADLVGPDGLVIVVDDDEGVESVRECDESNNVFVLDEATCL